MSRNPILGVFYRGFRPPGHPLHLEHILDGRFSTMDRDTLKYHLKRNQNNISKEQYEILNNILFRGECSSESDKNAINDLKKFIDPQGVYVAPGLYNFVLFRAPLMAGILSIIVLLSTVIFDKGIFEPSASKSTQTQVELSLLSSRIDDLEKKQSTLNQAIEAINKSPIFTEKTKAEIKSIISDEISRISLISHGNNYKTANLFSSSIIQQTQRSINEIIQKYQSIQSKLDNVEALVLNNPENVINLRLLQRDVVELSTQLSKKADMDILKEKEIRLAESISKDVYGLSRELEILRWVIYLLVIGLTASGGLIVVMQRRKQ